MQTQDLDPRCAQCGSHDLSAALAEQGHAVRLTCKRCRWTAFYAEAPDNAAPEQPAPKPLPSFAPRAGETPRESALAKRAVQERLRAMGVRIPVELAAPVFVLTDEEVAARTHKAPELTPEEQRRERGYQALLRRAGIVGGEIQLRGGGR